MQIVVDSTCDLTAEEAKALRVTMLLLKVHFGSESYWDKIDLTEGRFFEKLKSSAQMPTTTMVTPEAFLEEFARHPGEEILVVTVASLLSGTCQSAQVAKAEAGRDDVYVVDSGSASIGHSLLVREAVRLRDEGKSAREIREALERLKPRLRLFAMIDTLKYLVKGGRLSGAQGALGTILSLKPIITVRDGQVQSIDKARGVRAAIRRLRALVEREAVDRNMPVVYAHSGEREALSELRLALGIDAPVTWLGSVVGAHAGPGAVAVAFFSVK